MGSGARQYKWSLAFEDPTFEQTYLESQKQSLRWTVFVGHVVVLILDVLVFIDTNVLSNSRLDEVGAFDSAGSAIIFVWAAGVLSSLKIKQSKIGFTMLEFMAIFGTVTCMCIIVACSTYRLPKMFNHSPEEYWNQKCFADTYILLTLDLYITATHLFVPLRSSRSWTIPASATFLYAASCVAYGTPDGNPFVYIVELGILGSLAWVGRRRTEVESRHAFAREMGLSCIAEEKHKSMVQERVLRFDAERKLDIAKGKWAPTASGASQSISMPVIVGANTTAVDSSTSKSGSGSSPIDSSGIQPSLDDSLPVCFLPASATFLCKSNEDPNKFAVVQASNITPGQQICAFDKSTGDLAFAIVTNTGVSQELSMPSWCQLTMEYEGVDCELESTLLVSTVVVVKKKRGWTWRAPDALRIGEDALHGVLLKEATHVSSGPGGQVRSLRQVMFGVVCKEQVSTLLEFVGIQVAEPSKHAPLVGGASHSQDCLRPFVAVGSFARREVQFSSDSLSYSISESFGTGTCRNPSSHDHSIRVPPQLPVPHAST
eukprot:gnl/MRDRNA2_/MRDRNA2_78262_c0_seq4.p1 gnl/MRDRNA2_/MRDRNA2_78262_c0~~gnl/MRDRNA2_/MRDRNA2_78262_c0_seq4.p1  ORF type:complete len:544 (+),score=58.25 gnl/MRDRNA2_/MRDRNA2_78262_c0_seq4:71-1702(+)